MAWDHLSITKPHLVYIILGGFTSLFMLCSSVIKERMYIGEATVATVCGLIFGPHAANLIVPESWGSVDIVTIEFSRIVLVVQCFAVGVELPKFYMEKHWKSVVFLLVPVMTYGWLVTSLFVWWMVPRLNWLESLVVAACVTATDPVLASSVVGKGKFAKRVPKHLRDLLSAESGCNDGMAFPFIYLSLYLIQDHLSAREVTYHWLVFTVLYECIFGAIYGFMIGYFARHGIKFAEQHDLIDRESFLVFYFVLALFCAGSGSILGVDDLLVGFACGVGFSNDGWFGQKTEESHVSNVIDLLLNLTYFVYLGTIIPWEQFNNTALGLSAWRLTIIAIFVILFRRIPIMMALKPLIPDIKTWREALFAGHFGPIGVGAIFVAILARAELESENPVPLSQVPDINQEHGLLIALVWPIVTFLVIASIIVHGSSIAVFTLGKHINTLAITMSYTTANEEGPSWMNRLPRISSQSRSQARSMSETDVDELKMPEMPPGTLPPIGYPNNFLRRVRDEDNASHHGSRASSLAGRRRKKKWDDTVGPGGPISQSAIFPQRRSQSDYTSPTLQDSRETTERQDASDTAQSPGSRLEADAEKELEEGETPGRTPQESPEGDQREPVEVYDEGDHIVVENEQGDVLTVDAPVNEDRVVKDLPAKIKEEVDSGGWTYDSLKKKFGNWRDEEIQKRKEKHKHDRKHEPARAYQFGNTIIVEDEDGEVVKKYELPPQKPDGGGGDLMAQSLKYMGMGGLVKGAPKTEQPAEPSTSGGAEEADKAPGKPPKRSWTGFGREGEASAAQRERKKSVAEQQEEDDRQIRFTIGGVGQRMTKSDFIKEMQKLDKSTRREIVDQSSASQVVKSLAKQDPSPSPSPSPVSRQFPQTAADRRKAAMSVSSALTPAGDEVGSGSSSSPHPRERRPRSRSPSPSPSPSLTDEDVPSQALPETAVERRRRLAVLKGVQGDGDGHDDSNETPAERRRREAALGVSGADEDSDDDDTPRVPPARRGIRFADDPERGRI
ncbi:Na(+)/H(+) antiporter [Pleurostoma richardsiae]|uniref:Na(+)/H(+) antiporter n=1 Tax=Pleurostoma richardsiae TaxID=41990 RepID=A0AA38RMH6_9PEZI|nr:Na(+)/H(+) antiporter [Pleurostoma richardsiae]